MDYVATAVWKEGLHFEGESMGHTIQIDSMAEDNANPAGLSPMRLLLISLAACTAMDVISILKKMRQDVTHFEVVANAERATEHPKTYTSFEVVYKVRGHNVARDMVERAVELSEDKYCSVAAMLKDQAPVTTRIEIEQEQN